MYYHLHCNDEKKHYTTDKIIEYYISGDDYQVIDIPVCYTHNLKNIGNTTLICCFWMNDILSEQTPDDTYYEMV